MQNKQDIQIDAYNLVDLLVEVEKHIKAGYTFDLESNEKYPQHFGHRFFVPMVPVREQGVEATEIKQQESLEATEAEQTTETKQPKQTPGRKKQQAG